MKIVCWIIGHRWDYGYAVDFDLCRCDRCCRIDPPESWFSTLLHRLRSRWHWRIGVWLERCDDCGMRFKRHDPDVEHFPF